MSYYQDGGSIIHLPASTHAAYSHAPAHGTSTRMNYGTTTMNGSTDSGNLSIESQASLLDAGEILLTPAQNNRRKPDIGIIVSLLSFLVWLRLLQTMFYTSALGHLEGFIKEFLCVLLVWIPSITLTCFYFRSDDYQRRFRNWGR